MIKWTLHYAYFNILYILSLATTSYLNSHFTTYILHSVESELFHREFFAHGNVFFGLFLFLLLFMYSCLHFPATTSPSPPPPFPLQSFPPLVLPMVCF